eukprot:663513-Rhodomonas_salina.3
MEQVTAAPTARLITVGAEEEEEEEEEVSSQRSTAREVRSEAQGRGLVRGSGEGEDSEAPSVRELGVRHQIDLMRRTQTVTP